MPSSTTQKPDLTKSTRSAFASNLPPFNVQNLTLKDLQILREDFERTTEAEDVGELDIHMFTEVLQRHFSVSDEDAFDLFGDIDANKGGGIDWDELSTFLLFLKDDEETNNDDSDNDNDSDGDESDSSSDDEHNKHRRKNKNNYNNNNNNNNNNNKKSNSKITTKSYQRRRGKDRMLDITLMKDTTFRHADPTEGSFSPTSGFNHSEQITRMVCHPTVNKYFTCSRDGTLRSWNSETFELNSIVHYNRNNVWLNDMALCHSGRRVVTVGSDRTVSFYDCKSESFWKGFVGVPTSGGTSASSAISRLGAFQRDYLCPPGLCYPIAAKEIDCSRKKRRKMFREEQNRMEQESESLRTNLSKTSGRKSGLMTTTGNSGRDTSSNNNNNNKKKPFYYSSTTTEGLEDNSLVQYQSDTGNKNNVTGAKIRPLEAEHIILNDLKCSAMSVASCERPEDREGPMILGLENGSVHAYSFEEPNVQRKSLNAKHIWNNLHPHSFVSAVCYDSHLDCAFTGGGDGRIVGLPLREPKTIEITKMASDICSGGGGAGGSTTIASSNGLETNIGSGASSFSSLTMRAIYRLQSIPEYRLLLSCGSERCVKLWSPSSGLLPPIILESPGGVIVDACQMKNEPLIVTLDSEKVLKLWDIRTQRIVNQWHDSDSYRPHNTLSAVATDWKRQRIVTAYTAPVVHHLTRAIVPFPEPWYKGHQKPIVKVLKPPSGGGGGGSGNSSSANHQTSSSSSSANAAAKSLQQKNTKKTGSSSSSSTTSKDRFVTACEECVKIWNQSDGSLHATWSIPKLRSSAVTNGGAASSDGTTMVPGHITSIAFDQTGRRLFIMTSNGCGFIVNFYNGLLLRELSPMKGPNTNKGVATSVSALIPDDELASKKNNSSSSTVNDLTPPPKSQYYQHVSNSPQNYQQQQLHRSSNKVEGSYSQSSECSQLETLECSGERYVGCIQENSLLLWNDSQDGIAMDKKVDYILNVSLNYSTYCRLQPFREGGAVHISEMTQEQLLQEKRLWRNTMPTCLCSCPPLYIAVGTDAGVVLLFMMVPRFHLFRILGTVERTISIHSITYSSRYDLLFAAQSDGRLAVYSIADRSICWSLDHREPLAGRVPQLKSVCVLDRYVATTCSEGYVYFWSIYDNDEDDHDEDSDDFEGDEHDNSDDDDDENNNDENDNSNTLASTANRRASAVFDSLQLKKKKAAAAKKKKDKNSNYNNNNDDDKDGEDFNSAAGKSKILLKRQQEHQKRTEEYLRSIRYDNSSNAAGNNSTAANATTLYSQTQNLRRHSLASIFKTEESLQRIDAKEAAKTSITTFLPSTCHTQADVTFIGALRAHKEEAISCHLYYDLQSSSKNSGSSSNNNKNKNNINPRHVRKLPPRSLFCATAGSADCQVRSFDVFSGAFIGFCGSNHIWKPHSGREQFLIKKKEYRRKSISGDQVATAVLLMKEKNEGGTAGDICSDIFGGDDDNNENDSKLFREVSQKFLQNNQQKEAEKEKSPSPEAPAVFGGIDVADEDDFFDDGSPESSLKRKNSVDNNPSANQQHRRRSTVAFQDSNNSNSDGNEKNDDNDQRKEEENKNDQDDSNNDEAYEDIAAIGRDRIQKLTNTWISPESLRAATEASRVAPSIDQLLASPTSFSMMQHQQQQFPRSFSSSSHTSPTPVVGLNVQPTPTVLAPLDRNDVGVDYYKLMTENFVNLTRSMIGGIAPLIGSKIFDPVELATHRPGESQNNSNSKMQNKPPVLDPSSLLGAKNTSGSTSESLTPLSKLVDSAATPRIPANSSSTSAPAGKSVRFFSSNDDDGNENKDADQNHNKKHENVKTTSSLSSSAERSILKASFKGAAEKSMMSFMGFSGINDGDDDQNLVRVKNLKAKMRHGGAGEHGGGSVSPTTTTATVTDSNNNHHQKTGGKGSEESRSSSNPFIKEDKLAKLRKEKKLEQTLKAREDRRKQKEKSQQQRKQQQMDRRDQPLSSETDDSKDKNNNKNNLMKPHFSTDGVSPLVAELLEMSPTKHNIHGETTNTTTNTNVMNSSTHSSSPSITITAKPRGSPTQEPLQQQHTNNGMMMMMSHTSSMGSAFSSPTNSLASPQLQQQQPNPYHHQQGFMRGSIFDNVVPTNKNAITDPRDRNSMMMKRHSSSLPPPDMFSLNPHSSVLQQHKKQMERQQRRISRQLYGGLPTNAKKGDSTGNKNSNRNSEAIDDDEDLRNFLPSIQTARVQHQGSNTGSASLFSTPHLQNGVAATLSARTSSLSRNHGKKTNHNTVVASLPGTNQSAIINAELSRMKEAQQQQHSSRSPSSPALPAVDIARHGVKALFVEHHQSSSSSRQTNNANNNGSSSLSRVQSTGRRSSTTLGGQHTPATGAFTFYCSSASSPINSSSSLSGRMSQHQQEEYDSLQTRIQEWNLDRQLSKMTQYNMGIEENNQNQNDDGENSNKKNRKSPSQHQDNNSTSENNNQSTYRRMAAYLPPLDLELRDERKMQLANAKNLKIGNGTDKGARDRSDLVSKELEEVTSSNVVLRTATGIVTTSRAKRGKDQKKM